MKFVLFQKLAGLQGGGLVMFLLSVIAVAALLIGIIRYKKTSHPAPKNRTRALVYGALCVALSFMLSYIKLFSLPMGGSLTLCSMLPIAAYACAFGPLYGFVAGLAFGMPAAHSGFLRYTLGTAAPGLLLRLCLLRHSRLLPQ